MPKLNWKPWHEETAIRDDLKTGELSLQMFAADRLCTILAVCTFILPSAQKVKLSGH